MTFKTFVTICNGSAAVFASYVSGRAFACGLIGAGIICGILAILNIGCMVFLTRN